MRASGASGARRSVSQQPTQRKLRAMMLRLFRRGVIVVSARESGTMCLRSEIDISWLRKNMLHTAWEKSKIFHSKRFRDFSNDSFKVAQAYTKTLRSSLSCNEK